MCVQRIGRAYQSSSRVSSSLSLRYLSLSKFLSLSLFLSLSRCKSLSLSLSLSLSTVLHIYVLGVCVYVRVWQLGMDVGLRKVSGVVRDVGGEAVCVHVRVCS